MEHHVYASSSFVYGGNKKMPFSTDDKMDNPVSLYAATKKRDELLAHAYSKLYNIPSIGLHFFTVYIMLAAYIFSIIAPLQETCFGEIRHEKHKEAINQ